MLNGFPSFVLAGDAATPPRRHASSFTKNDSTGARVTEAVSPSTSTSGASTAAASECGTPHPKRRRLTSKQSPDAAWQKPLALPEQLLAIDTYFSEREPQNVQAVGAFVQSMEVCFAIRASF